jgi:hypothetical protein
MLDSGCRSNVRKHVFSAKTREDVRGHRGEGSWRSAHGPIEHRAKRHTVLLRDLRAVSLLLCVEKLACLIANIARCRTVGFVPLGAPLVPKRGSSHWFGSGQSAAPGLTRLFIAHGNARLPTPPARTGSREEARPRSSRETADGTCVMLGRTLHAQSALQHDGSGFSMI